MSCGSDYYQILGVLRSAKLSEITAAYHALAQQCHPDAGAGDAESLAKFKAIARAYEVLSDDGKRREYDRRFSRSKRSSVPTSSFGFAAPFKSVDVPSSLTPRMPVRAANDLEIELPIAPEEARFGGPCSFTLDVTSECRDCHGRGSSGNDPCSVCRGTGKSRERRRLEMMLPRGVQSGAIIRIAGQGGRSATSTGDLFVRLRVQPCW
jgi:molecular chaperone DnaJ